MSIDQANKLDLKLYLEGIEVACSNVQIVEDAKGARATVQIPVDDAALKIESRTTVHLFYKDTSLPEWVLIFEGEVSTINVSKQLDSRTVTLKCVPLHSHWDYVVKSPDNKISYTGQVATKVNVTFGSVMTDGVPQEVKDYRDGLDQMPIGDIPELAMPVYEEIKGRYDIPDSEEEAKRARDKKAKSYDSADYTVNVNNYGLSMFNFATIAKEILKTRGNDSNLSIVISKLTNDFARSNIGYTPFHMAYQLSRRVVGFKNDRLDSLMDSNDMQTYLRLLGGNSPGSTTLTKMVSDFLDVFNYIILYPSAPTYDEAGKVPQNFIAMPETDLLAPIACNTIFKDEVISASYEKNKIREITRLGTHVYPSVNTADHPLAVFNEIMLAPGGQLAYRAIDKSEGNETAYATQLQLLLTREERLRGINGDVIFDDFANIKAKLDAEKAAEIKDSMTDAEKEEAGRGSDAFTRDFRGRWVDNEFQKRVLSARSFSITTQYSPYRICGLPALYMDDVLPCVIGNISQIINSIDPNGTAMSQITFSNSKDVRPEDKIVPEDLTDLGQWLELTGLTKEESTDPKILIKKWPFTDEELKEEPSSAQKERWVAHLRRSVNNPTNLIFLNSWLDDKTYYPDSVGRKIYRKLMYGVEYDPTPGAPVPNFESDKNNERFKIGINEVLDGGVSRFQKEDKWFEADGAPGKDRFQNTALIAHYVKTLQDAYENTPDNRKKDFADKFKRRRLVTEDEFWKFLINLPEGTAIEQLDDLKTPGGLQIGIRDIDDSVSNEAKTIVDLITENKTIENKIPASAPFIKSRRGIIRNMKKNLLKNGHYIGGKS